MTAQKSVQNRVQKIERKKAKPFLFLFGQAETDLPGIGDAGRVILDALEPFVKENGIKPTGPGVWMYEQRGGGKVLLQAGFTIGETPKSTGDFMVTQVPAWDCISGEYKGSMAHIAEAWDEFIEQVRRDSHVPSAFNREIYQKWLGHDSEENVTELQVKIK
jgi:effector-binding domain-containing protein